MSAWVRKADAAGAAPADNPPLQMAEDLKRLRRENEILLKASALFASKQLCNQAKRARFRFIDSHRSEYGVAEMCSALKVTRQGCYARASRAPSAHGERDAELACLIGGAYEASRGVYGSLKVHQVLRRQGMRTSRKRVARIMSEHGWRGTARGNARRPRGTGKQAAHAPRVPDPIGRDFSAKGTNKAWFADTTYVRTRQG